MPDEISRLSLEVARDPGGPASLALAEALRRTGRLAAAEETVVRALQRQPYRAEGHEVLARIALDLGDPARARDEWETALQLDPHLVGAFLGLAYLAVRSGDAVLAAAMLDRARAVSPTDPRVVAASRRVEELIERRVVGQAPAIDEPPHAAPGDVEAGTCAPPAVPHAARDATSREKRAGPRRPLFADLEEAGAERILLVDRDGLVLAGTGEGADALGAELSGLGGESERALGQLGLGSWERLTVECGSLILTLAPSREESVVVVATRPETPMGLARLLLRRAGERASSWLDAL